MPKRVEKPMKNSEESIGTSTFPLSEMVAVASLTAERAVAASILASSVELFCRTLDPSDNISFS